jgi:molybdenum cofactor cytidylyltransferase
VSEVAAIILAAGGSRRLGTPKQLVTLAGERLLDRTLRIAREADLNPQIVVLGANAERIQDECSLESATVIINKEWDEGLGVSLASGVRTLPLGIGAVILTCDQPAVTADHLRLLFAENHFTASEYGGRHGVPAFFPAAIVQTLATLRGDAGARALLDAARSIVLPGGDLDIDTVEALAEAKKLYG